MMGIYIFWELQIYYWELLRITDIVEPTCKWMQMVHRSRVLSRLRRQQVVPLGDVQCPTWGSKTGAQLALSQASHNLATKDGILMQRPAIASSVMPCSNWWRIWLPQPSDFASWRNDLARQRSSAHGLKNMAQDYVKLTKSNMQHDATCMNMFSIFFAQDTIKIQDISWNIHKYPTRFDLFWLVQIVFPSFLSGAFSRAAGGGQSRAQKVQAVKRSRFGLTAGATLQGMINLRMVESHGLSVSPWSKCIFNLFYYCFFV